MVNFTAKIHLHMKSLTSLLLLTALTIGASAQKVKLIEGDVSLLKGQTTVNTKFAYDGMTISKKEEAEADYINTKKAEYNGKTPGKGDTWAKAWVDDRQDKYEPRFDNEFAKESGMTVDSKAKYTIILKSKNLEPGYNIAISSHPAELAAEVWVVESANPSNVIAKISITNAPGRMMGADFDTGIRITECYATAAKGLARLIRKS